MTPHPFQLDYLNDIREGWKLFGKQLVVSPTGSGKACMFSWMTREAVGAGERVLILVDQDELVWQTIDKLQKVAGIEGEPEKAEYSASHFSKCVVATVQSMARRLSRWPEVHFNLIIADEADRSISPQWQTVLNHFDKHARVCGFTATPWRSDLRNLGEYYENAIERENLFSLINKGFLSPVSVSMMPIKLDLSGKGNGRDFTDDEADEIIRPHLEEIAKAIQSHASFRRTLVFLPLIKTCETFNDIARDVGLSSEFIYGQDPERETKLQRFRNWDFDVLANSMLLTRGVDIPQVDCIVPCRPTKSITLYMQIVGRGTRKADGKSDCLLLDFLYDAQKKMVCRPAHLIAKSEEEAQQITQLATEQAAGLPADVAAELPMDLQVLATEATAKREEALRKKLEQQRNKKAKVVSAAEFAMSHGSLEAAEFEPTMKWESEEVSDKQKWVLKRAGIDVATVNGKGHASKLISLVKHTTPVQLASPGAIAAMTRSGYTRGIAASIGITNFTTVTQAQAGRFFAALNQKKKEPQLI